MKRVKTMLRQNAAMAKRRLGTGFWNQTHERRNLENLNNPDTHEEKIYRNVANVLGTGNTNPLGAVLDHDYMRQLDDAARQRYVLNMSQIVNKSIERYNQVC